MEPMTSSSAGFWVGGVWVDLNKNLKEKERVERVSMEPASSSSAGFWVGEIWVDVGLESGFGPPKYQKKEERVSMEVISLAEQTVVDRVLENEGERVSMEPAMSSISAGFWVGKFWVDLERERVSMKVSLAEQMTVANRVLENEGERVSMEPMTSSFAGFWVGEFWVDLERERVSMEVSLAEIVLKKVNEALTWVKAETKAFFKLLSKNIIEGLLLGVKSFVIKCCEKFKQILVSINSSFIDAGMTTTLSEANLSLTNVEEKIFMLNKFVQLARTFAVPLFKVVAGHESRHEGEKVNLFLDLVEGFIELLQIGLNKPLQLIIIFYNGCMIHFQNTANNSISTMRIQKGGGRASGTIAFILGLLHTNIF